MKLSQQLKSFASEDIAAIVKMANFRSNADMKVTSLKFDKPDYQINADNIEDIVVTAIAAISTNNGSFDFEWDYMVDGDSIYIQAEDSELAMDLVDRYNENTSVNSATSTNKTPIMAAGEDDFDELTDHQVEDDTFEDSIDDLSDKVDDLQDTVDDVNEDEPAIEADNNISNHYIAECDNCHGIFISAVVESDQEVKSISGTCPLCEKETEQLLKWVIKDVTDGE